MNAEILNMFKTDMISVCTAKFLVFFNFRSLFLAHKTIEIFFLTVSNKVLIFDMIFYTERLFEHFFNTKSVREIKKKLFKKWFKEVWSVA